MPFNSVEYVFSCFNGLYFILLTATFKPLESIKIKSDLLESAKKYVEKKIREDVNFDKSQLNSTLMGLSTLAYYPNNDAGTVCTDYASNSQT